MTFYDQDHGKDEKMFHLWFNTGFVENNFLCFHKPVVDKANKDKHCKKFDAEFQVQIFMHQLQDDEFRVMAIEDDDDDDDAAAAADDMDPGADTDEEDAL